MCHYYEGYHTTLASEIDAVEFDRRGPREELSYDLPWSVMAMFVAVVGAIAMALGFAIKLLA